MRHVCPQPLPRPSPQQSQQAYCGSGCRPELSVRPTIAYTWRIATYAKTPHPFSAMACKCARLASHCSAGHFSAHSTHRHVGLMYLGVSSSRCAVDGTPCVFRERALRRIQRGACHGRARRRIRKHLGVGSSPSAVISGLNAHSCNMHLACRNRDTRHTTWPSSPSGQVCHGRRRSQPGRLPTSPIQPCRP